jgi:pimeloyl-ACP methyl ester carboxylesterase
LGIEDIDEVMAKQPLLFLTGILCDATIWRHQIEDLADIADPKVPDYRDCDSLPAMAAKALAAAPARFALAGHSMGARVALEMFRVAPERITHLALVDTSVAPIAPGEPALRKTLLDAVAREGTDVLLRDWLPPMVHDAYRNDASIMEPLRNMVRSMTPEIFARQVSAMLSRPEERSLLAKITCPALVLCGRFDSWRTPEQHAEWAYDIPGVVFEIVEDCGHMAPWETPAEVTAALRRWLARPSAT